jgi:hypothetical protein
MIPYGHSRTSHPATLTGHSATPPQRRRASSLPFPSLTLTPKSVTRITELASQISYEL